MPVSNLPTNAAINDDKPDVDSLEGIKEDLGPETNSRGSASDGNIDAQAVARMVSG